MDSLYTGIDYLGDKESAITLIFIFPMIIRDLKKKDNTIRKGQFGKDNSAPKGPIGVSREDL